MAQRDKMFEERERIEKEYTKRLNIHMAAFKKRDDLLPKFHDTPNGVMAELVLTPEYLDEYDKADKEEREASIKLRETLERLWEINKKLQ
jgi:hypothetical protein